MVEQTKANLGDSRAKGKKRKILNGAYIVIGRLWNPPQSSVLQTKPTSLVPRIKERIKKKTLNGRQMSPQIYILTRLFLHLVSSAFHLKYHRPPRELIVWRGQKLPALKQFFEVYFFTSLWTVVSPIVVLVLTFLFFRQVALCTGLIFIIEVTCHFSTSALNFLLSLAPNLWVKLFHGPSSHTAAPEILLVTEGVPRSQWLTEMPGWPFEAHRLC